MSVTVTPMATLKTTEAHIELRFCLGVMVIARPGASPAPQLVACLHGLGSEIGSIREGLQLTITSSSLETF